MNEKRKYERKLAGYTSYIRKKLPQGGETLMQFVTMNVSENGIFILSDDLSLFDLGDIVELMVDNQRDRYFEGKARVVRSVRTFSEEGSPTESGYGIMLMEPSSEYLGMVSKIK